MKPFETVEVRGVRLRRDPAREPCFTVVHLHSEMRLSQDFSEDSKREKFHRDCNNEVESLEIAAQALVDFPEAPWELRYQLARQCWDEARRAAMYYRRLLEIGGYKGEFPIANHEWAVVGMYDSLAARLAIQNRSFEAGSLDSLRKGVAVWTEMGDERTAEIVDAVLADEIQHVRMANRWLKDMAKENPRVLLKVASAMADLKRVVSALAPRLGEVSLNGMELGAHHTSFRTSPDDRRTADFSEEEVAEILGQDQRDAAAADSHSPSS